MFSTSKSRLCLALDPDPEKMGTGNEQDYWDESAGLHKRLDALKGAIGMVKLNSVFDIWGDCAYHSISQMGLELLADLKLHDIPNTVAARVHAIRRKPVWGITIHATGGKKMIEEAARAARDKVLIFAVTVLTSLDYLDLKGMFGSSVYPPEYLVPCLAEMAVKAGVPGIICSPLETEAVREVVGPNIIIGNPGIRFLNPDARPDDQKRVATPGSAIRAEADFVIMGRDLGNETDCARAIAEIENALKER